jgi:hypothetical protein
MRAFGGAEERVGGGKEAWRAKREVGGGAGGDGATYGKFPRHCQRMVRSESSRLRVEMFTDRLWTWHLLSCHGSERLSLRMEGHIAPVERGRFP